MALNTMYDAMPNSPQTTLAEDIAADATSMTLADASVLPAAPNLCTLGVDENAEVVSYTTITGNVVSGLIRGISGTTASVWTTGTVVARDYTSYDHDTFIDNIEELNNTKLESVDWGDIGGTLSDQSDLVSAFALKADLASPQFTGTPLSTTPTAGDNTTKIATTAFVQGEINTVNTAMALKAPIASPTFTGTPKSVTPTSGDSSTNIATTAFVHGELDKQILVYKSQNVSAGTNAQIMRIPASGTDSKITTDTVLLGYYTSNNNYLRSNLSWESFSGYFVITGTCTTSTTATVYLGKQGN